MSHVELVLSPVVTVHVAPSEHVMSQEFMHDPVHVVPAPQVTCVLDAAGIVQENPAMHVALPPVVVQPGPGHADGAPASPTAPSDGEIPPPQAATSEAETKRNE